MARNTDATGGTAQRCGADLDRNHRQQRLQHGAVQPLKEFRQSRPEEIDQWQRRQLVAEHVAPFANQFGLRRPRLSKVGNGICLK